MTWRGCRIWISKRKWVTKVNLGNGFTFSVRFPTPSFVRDLQRLAIVWPRAASTITRVKSKLTRGTSNRCAREKRRIRKKSWQSRGKSLQIYPNKEPPNEPWATFWIINERVLLGEAPAFEKQIFMQEKYQVELMAQWTGWTRHNIITTDGRTK